MIALPLMALGVSVFEVIGAGASFVLLGLPTNPDVASELLPVQVLASLLRVDDLRELRFAVAGAMLVFFALRGAALVARTYVEQRIVTSAAVEVAERLLDGYLTMPYRFHVSRNSAKVVCNAYVKVNCIPLHSTLPCAGCAPEGLQKPSAMREVPGLCHPDDSSNAAVNDRRQPLPGGPPHES